MILPLFTQNLNRTMKEEAGRNLDRQEKTVYVAVPMGEQGEDTKISMNDHGKSQVRKMHLLSLLLLLGMTLFFVHKVMFYHHVSNVFHFAKHGPPCDHHVRFNPIPNDEHHHAMNADSMGPPHGMHHPPHHGDFARHHDEHHHHMNPHNMDHHKMSHSGGHHNAESHDFIYHPLPPAAVETQTLSNWNGFYQKDSSDDKDVPSFDSSDSGDESSKLDVWERIADLWTGSKDHSKDSLDTSGVGDDESNELDVWERIADFWVTNKDNSKDSSDSLDDSDDEDE